MFCIPFFLLVSGLIFYIHTHRQLLQGCRLSLTTIVCCSRHSNASAHIRRAVLRASLCLLQALPLSLLVADNAHEVDLLRVFAQGLRALAFARFPSLYPSLCLDS